MDKTAGTGVQGLADPKGQEALRAIRGSEAMKDRWAREVPPDSKVFGVNKGCMEDRATMGIEARQASKETRDHLGIEGPGANQVWKGRKV
jgi:hypothetical protein